MKSLIASLALSLPFSATALAATTGTSTSNVPAGLSTVSQATEYAAVRGVTLAKPTQGVHATREGKLLYDETEFVAETGAKVSVLRFTDAAEAREMAPVLAEGDANAKSYVRGRIVFITHDIAVLDALIKPPALPRDLAEVDHFLAAQGMTVAEKRSAAPNDGPELVDYTLASGAKIDVYRFESSDEATHFADGAARDGVRVIGTGHIVFVVPEASAALFDKVASSK